MKTTFNLLFLLIPSFCLSQMGKDGVQTINTNTIVNEYTDLTSNVSSGSSSINVTSSSLNDNGRFTGNLEPGDLLFIYQTQGASIDASTFGYVWGEVTNYNNCGNYEFVEVSNVPNGNTINLRCGLQNSYTAAGHVQVIRVPRFTELIVNAEITSPAWDGTIGGVVVIESETDVTITASGSIDVTGLGFRGGVSEYTNSYWGSGQFGSNDHDEGAAKGESIVGFVTEYNAINSERAQGAPANGGGGGNGHNAGGGGGSNGGAIANYQDGVGVPDPTYNTAWALETPNISGVTSSGGGKGGYTFSGSAQNPLSVAPGNSSWGSDNRRNVGGRGGRPLDYTGGKIFFGGGGGSGDLNNSQNTGGSGGAGGGLVFIRAYGDLIGSGDIDANGLDGELTTTSTPPNFSYAGEDGAGGAGAGGTIVLDIHGSTGAINCSAVGGNGGNQVLVPGNFFFGSINEAEGPGGGGSGGKILYTGGSFSSNLSGGSGGTTNSGSMSNFPYNGATGGGDGDMLDISSNIYSIIAENDTICSGNSTTLTASTVGSLPAGTSIIWYDAPVNGNFIGAGTNFTTGNLSNDTTFYVGFCPGSYTIPVSVIMGTSFNFDTTSVVINDENCGQSDGSISGISVSGGAQPLQYEWNAVLTVDQDLTGSAAGSYTLVITDDNGCGANIGTFVIGENSGPAIDTTAIIVQDDQCSQSVGSISGITASGESPFTYEWDGVPSASINLTNVSAGLYDLEVFDAFGCSSLIEDISVGNVSGPTIDTSGIIIEDDHCGQTIGSISGISASGIGPFTYTWNGNTTLSADTIGLFASSYELIVTDAYGCSDSVSGIVVQDISGPSIDTTLISISNETCEGLNGSIANISVTGSGPFTYYWNGSLDTLDNTGLVAGSYDLIVEDSFGCQDSVAGIVVGSDGYPTAEVSYTSGIIYAGDTIDFIDVSGGEIVNSIFTLSDGTIVNDTIASEFYGDRGVYDICLSVENIYGCVDSICIEITVSPSLVAIEVPNIFTPNQDGINDYFYIEGVDNNYNLQIFNRWGQIVFSESPYLNVWDGMATNGKPLSDGTYYYVLEVIDPDSELETKTGVITLTR